MAISRQMKIFQGIIGVLLGGTVLVYFYVTTHRIPPKCDGSRAIDLVTSRVRVQPSFKGGQVTIENIRTTNANETYAVCLADITVAGDGKPTEYKDVNYTLGATAGGDWRLTMPGWAEATYQPPPSHEQ